MCKTIIHIEKKSFVFDNLDYIKETKIMDKIINKINKKLKDNNYGFNNNRKNKTGTS